jgi:hypothetical protein
MPAEGYLIAEIDATTRQPLTYWNGSLLVEEQQAAIFVTDLVSARMSQGALLAQYPEKDIALLPARQTIQIVPPTPTPAPTPTPTTRTATP